MSLGEQEIWVLGTGKGGGVRLAPSTINPARISGYSRVCLGGGRTGEPRTPGGAW